MERKILTEKRQILFYFALCFMAYYSTYLGRLNYSACLAEMIRAEGLSRARAGLIGTAFFCSYGAGQLLAGFLGDRWNGKWLVFAGMSVSGVMNAAMGLMQRTDGMIFVWCLNGAAQALIWSPLLHTICSMLEEKTRSAFCIYINYSVPLGTVSSYGLSAVLLGIGGWRMAFLVPAVLVIGMACLWLYGMGRLGYRESREAGRQIAGKKAAGAASGAEAAGVEVAHGSGTALGTAAAGADTASGVPVASGSGMALEARAVSGVPVASGSGAAPGAGAVREQSTWRIFWQTGLFFLLFALCVQGALKDGITTWIPTYLQENHDIGSVASILSTMVIPLCNLAGVFLASQAQKKTGENEIRSASIFFCICAGALGILLVAGGRSAVLALAMLAAATTSMMAVNSLLISVLPSRFGRSGKASSVSGILNSCVYAGCAASTYGIGALSEWKGWSFTILLWVAGAAAAFVICLGVSGKFAGWAKAEDQSAEKRRREPAGQA